MRFFYDLIIFIKEHYFILLLCLLLIIINDAFIISDLYSLKTINTSENKLTSNFSDNISSNNKFKVDIKGYVKKPGVYEVSDNMNINDLIILSGGLKKGATTKNLNLSKKLSDQMVVIVSNSSSFKKSSSSSSSLDSTNYVKNDAIIDDANTEGLVRVSDINTTSNSKVNINVASIDELLTLSGIGESKAKAIIEYRSKESFTSIEDIKNISGIGESLFEKIKDSITV